MKSRSTFIRLTRSTGIIGIAMLLGMVLSTAQLNAQCWQWAVSTGGDNSEVPMDIAVSPSGTVAVTGEFSGMAIIGSDTLVAAAGKDVFTFLLDSSGVILNAMGGMGDGTTNIGNGIASDNDGNFYITGNFRETIFFGDTSLVSEGLLDIFIVKYDASGNLVWATRAGGSSEINSSGIAVDGEGSCYIVGDFYNTASFGDLSVESAMAQDVFTVKYDTDGNVLWAASSGAVGTDNGLGIAVDHSGNVYICGLFQSTYIFNNVTYTSRGNRDGFVAKYDTEGNPLWAIAGGGWNNEFFNKVAVDGTGEHVYVTGDFESDSMIMDGLVLLNSNPTGLRKDIFLMSLNGEGTPQWGTSAGASGHDFVNDIAVDDMGDVYITGTFEDTIVFGSTTLVKEAPDLYIAKFDPSGAVQWAKKPTYNSASAVGSALTTFRNRPLLAGYFAAGSAPPLLVFDNDTLISNGSLDTYVAKMGPPCNQVSTGIAPPGLKNPDLMAYPNPFTEVLYLQRVHATNGPVEISLLNAQGQLIHRERFNDPGRIELNTSHLPDGFYVLQAWTGETRQSIKLVKAKH